MGKVVKFFQESYAELKKVVWPSKDEVIASTKVVVVSVVIISLALGLVDWVLLKGMNLFF